MHRLGSRPSLPSVTGFAVHPSRAWGAAALLLGLGLWVGNRVKKRKLYHRPPNRIPPNWTRAKSEPSKSEGEHGGQRDHLWTCDRTHLFVAWFSSL